MGGDGGGVPVSRQDFIDQLPLEVNVNWRLEGTFNRRIKQLIDRLSPGAITHVVFIAQVDAGEVHVRPARDGEEGRVLLRPSKGYQTYSVRMTNAMLRFPHLRPERGRLTRLSAELRPADGALVLNMKEAGSMPSPGAGRGLGVRRGPRKKKQEPASGQQDTGGNG